MADPLISTGTGATIAFSGLTIAGLYPVANAGVLIAAFAGSLIFVLTDKEFSRLVRWLLFIASMLAGIVAAPFVAAVISYITPEAIEARLPIGALVASAVAVKILMALMNDPFSFLTKLRGGGKPNAK
ncbi:MAG: phage holin family protein [Ewingella sp.]|uniref:putative holin n=1 Tax=Dryocola clanedunensis TaxID=2925396 RepID=UPI0022F050AB|nr:putative holin [Dryocola clanedunensis]MCT4713235.1 phage holin family protein [Dryocola clanedunensis]MDN5681336.1 phage holin family protein [Ewingella sp.]